MKRRPATAKDAAQTRMHSAVQSPASPLLVFPGGMPLKSLQNASGLLSRAWNWFRERQAARSNPKRLHVASTVSLGEKRFVAVIHVDDRAMPTGFKMPDMSSTVNSWSAAELPTWPCWRS